MAIALSGSLILSGSIIVSGSITSTGTVIMSGSIASASYALNATTGAYANTSTSASYALNATTFNNTASSVFATTGSNTFIGNQVVSGSLTTSGSITATGTITAQTLVIQTITSSVVYSSGSNIFGNAIGNTQTFTGSVLVTGSLTIAGGSSATSYSGATIYGSTAVCSPVGKFTSCIDVGGAGTFSGNVTNVSALYVRASGNSDLPFINFSNADGVYNWGRVGGLLQGDGDGSLYFQTKLGGSLGTRLTITSTGASTFSSTITGTTIYGSTAVCSPVGKFTSCVDAGSGTFSGILTINAGTSATSVNICSNGDFISNWIGNCTSQFFSIRNNTSVGVYLNTQNSSPLILGVSTGTSGGSVVNHLSIASGGAASFACSVGIGTNDPFGPLVIYKSNSGGLGGHIILNNNGSAVANETAVMFGDGGITTIRAAISSTTENAPYFGDLKFKTGAGTYACLSTRMTIAGSTGYVGINITSACKHLEVGGTIRTTAAPSSYYRDTNYIGDTFNFGAGETTDNVDFKICGGSTWSSGGNFRWWTQAGNSTPIERMRITSGGVVQITNSSDAQLSLAASGTTAYVRFANSAGDVWGIGNSFSAANTDFQLYNFTTAAYGFRVSRGGIYANTTAVAANVQIDSNGYFARSTSSLKYKNSVTNYDKGLDIVNQLRPVYYKGNNDGDKQFAGLIAEEVHELGLTEFVQYADDGSPDALAYSHMVALLTKAIQEQQAQIEALKVEIEILKNKII